MKLKSLLLGSAAVLALSAGAQAADPIVEFVSLGVCDAYGITGLTIESDDTCLSISGEVSYEYTQEDFGAWDVISDVSWELNFEATTQTDAGAAVAFIGLVDSQVVAWTDRNNNDVIDAGEAGFIDGVGIDQAYVQFGDTTVLSAGLKDKILDTEVLDRTYGGDAHEFFDWDLDESELTNRVAQGGHVITIESLVAEGFTVIAGLEDLENNGTALLAVQYANAGISAEVAVLLGDLYDNLAIDPVNFYAAVTAEFDTVEARAAVILDDTGFWIASLGASAAFDMFSIDADAWFAESDEWGIAAEGSFDATETVAVYLGAGYQDLIFSEYFTVYGGVDFDVTETLTANAELGFVDESAVGDYVYGVAGVTYAPGGGFETSLSAFAATDDHYKVTFEASKEF